MTQSILETASAARLALLVTLTYGATPTVRRYTRWTDDLVIGGQTFTAEPALDVELGEQHGGTEDKPGKLTIPVTRAPFDRLVTGYKHPRVQFKVEQVDPSDPSSRRTLGFGWLGLITKNPAGRSGLVRAQLAGIKSRLAEIKVSLPLTTTCQVPFGGTHCRVDASAWTRTGTVALIGSPDRTSVTLTLPGVSDPATDLPNSKYRRGVLLIDGLPLLIRRSREDFTFDLFCLPPPWIVGQSCILKAGCDKRLETCKGEWDNEINFMGLGIKIPPYNPLLETA